MSKPTINITYTVDDNYIDFMGVSIYSLKKNSSKDYFYNVYVLYNNGHISKENKQKILSLEEDEA